MTYNPQDPFGTLGRTDIPAIEAADPIWSQPAQLETLRLIVEGDAARREGNEVPDDTLDPFGLMAGAQARPLDQPVDASGAVVVQTENLELAPMEYYIRPWLPKRRVILFGGDGESGKSSFVNTVVAKASVRKRNPVGVLWLTAEEDLPHVQARFSATGGNPELLGVVQAHPKLLATGVKVAFDVYKNLRSTVESFKAQLAEKGHTLGIVVLDTLLGLTEFPDKQNANDDKSVKALLAFVQDIATELDVCIVFIQHTRKASADNKAHRIAGSASWTSSVRLGFICDRLVNTDDGDEEAGEVYPPYLNVLSTVKGNTAGQFAVRYTTVPVVKLDSDTADEDDDDGNAFNKEDGPKVVNVLCAVEWSSQLAVGAEAVAKLMPQQRQKSKKTSKAAMSKMDEMVVHISKAVREEGCTSRDAIVARLKELGADNIINRRQWVEIDELLSSVHKISISKGAHGVNVYSALVQ